MSPRKLTTADKDEILRLYRSSLETTSTLAERFEVSSSTISRFLKSRLPEHEYEDLIQQKRLSRTPSGAAQVLLQAQESDVELEPELNPRSPLSLEAEEFPDAWDDAAAEGGTVESVRRRRRRSAAAPEAWEPQEEEEAETTEVAEAAEAQPERSRPVLAPIIRTAASSPTPSAAADLEDLLDEEIDDLEDDDEDDDFEDFEDDEDEDDEEDDDDDEDDEDPLTARTPKASVDVLPITDANLPRICYLVIDRASELIACPLSDFSDLGEIPATEVQQKTLPVFDNHRIARRFSQRRRSQRVLKIPDSRILAKAQDYLYAKGITRLLFDGQVYDLTDS